GRLREDRLAPASMMFLSRLLGEDTPEALALLKRAHERHPPDFWLTLRLACQIAEMSRADKTRLEEAIGYFRSARALRPGSSLAHDGLGHALREKGDLAGAVASHRAAIRSNCKFASGHGALGEALLAFGDFTAARDATRRCLQLLPPTHPLRRGA